MKGVRNVLDCDFEMPEGGERIVWWGGGALSSQALLSTDTSGMHDTVVLNCGWCVEPMVEETLLYCITHSVDDNVVGRRTELSTGLLLA